MADIIEEELEIRVTEDGNGGKIESQDILNIIKKNNLDNINVAKYTGEFELNKVMDIQIDNKDEVVMPTKEDKVEIEDVKKEEVSTKNEVDTMFERIGMSKEMQNEVRKMLEDIQTTFQATYDKKEREMESKKNKEIEDYKRKLESDTLRTLNAEEQERYKRDLQQAADKQKIDFLSKRVNELENHISEIENQKFISEKISSCPSVKPFIEKMKIRTKEEYINKIEPIIEDIKQYDDFKKNNKNGNSNAFKGYGRQSQYAQPNKTSVVDKAYMNEFFKNNIRK